MKRSEVPVEQTWDLSIIYKTDEDAWKDADEIRKLADEVGVSGTAIPGYFDYGRFKL